MVPVNLKSLVERLNPTCRECLEGAAGLCLSRTNYNVEVEHWLLKLLDPPSTDIAAILRHADVDVARLRQKLTAVLDRLKTGNGRSPALSPQLVDWMREAWCLGSLDYGARAIRSGHLLCAMLSNDGLLRLPDEVANELRKIPVQAVRADFVRLTANTKEAEAEQKAAATTGISEQAAGDGAAKGGALDQFTLDLTALAAQGKIDPVLGRDAEIRQIVDILMRRRQNNPILTGEAGVGKTAIVEGFALQVVAGTVPEPLRNVVVRSLDLGQLQAGAGIRGEFERRLKSVIDEVKASPKPVILFIDEAHTLIGAGGSSGQGDAANLLKPALARGELRTIAATTWAEYKKYFEKDAALARRFQVVRVEEPSTDAAVGMMRGLAASLEKHHQVRILDEALVDAVKLSQRYLSGRQLPDKAVSLLDTACARVAISQSSTPPAIEDRRRRISELDTAIGILTRERLTGAQNQAKLDELAAAKNQTEQELASLEARWKQELELAKRTNEIRGQLEASTPEEQDRLREQLAAASEELAAIQGQNPLVKVCVDAQAIAEVVAGWTGIPVGRMVTNEVRAILSLKEEMEKRVVGQPHALEAIAQRIRTARASLTDPRRPIGVFLLVGPSGVGKTETAITLAELLYGGDQNMTVINMSEFKEEHKVSLLMGSPPGYVGYGEGGVLTEAVRRRPYSVVLLDEMEKAHPGVQDIFYQVFDKGTLRDGEGRDIDFRNTVILMTSNAGTDLIMRLCEDLANWPEPEELTEVLHDELLRTFKPAFLGRVTLVPYYPLTEPVMRSIAELQLGRIARRVAENHRAAFRYSPEMVSAIVSRCTEVDSGARNIDHILTRTLLPQLSKEFLSRMAEGVPITSVEVSIDAKGEFQYLVA